MSYTPSVQVILAEELNPQYVDNNIRVYQNGNEVAFAYATPYDSEFTFSDGDTISAMCNADISPTGGANPFKVLQILERYEYFSGRCAGKLLWVYQDTSPGNNFTFPGINALNDQQYIFLASSTSNGTGWYFMNLFNTQFSYGDPNDNPITNKYTIDQVLINGYTTVYPNLAPGNHRAIPNPNGSIIPAGTTVDIHVSTPDPTTSFVQIVLAYQEDGYCEPFVGLGGTGWYSITLTRDVNTSKGGINLTLDSMV